MFANLFFWNFPTIVSPGLRVEVKILSTVPCGSGCMTRRPCGTRAYYVYGDMNCRLTTCMETWIAGLLRVWKHELQAYCVHGNMNCRLTTCMETWIAGLLRAWKHELQAYYVYGNINCRLTACMETWIAGLLRAWKHELQVFQIPYILS